MLMLGDGSRNMRSTDWLWPPNNTTERELIIPATDITDVQPWSWHLGTVPTLRENYLNIDASREVHIPSLTRWLHKQGTPVWAVPTSPTVCLFPIGACIHVSISLLTRLTCSWIFSECYQPACILFLLNLPMVFCVGGVLSLFLLVFNAWSSNSWLIHSTETGVCIVQTHTIYPEALLPPTDCTSQSK